MQPPLSFATLPAIAVSAALVAPASAQMPVGGDARQVVALSVPVRTHTIADMRAHRPALREIDESLAKGGFPRASRIACRAAYRYH